MSSEQVTTRSATTEDSSITTAESGTMSSLRNYADIVKSICKSSGLFTTRYKQVETQISTMNRVMEQVSSTAVASVKNDLYNILTKTIDWNDYKNRLISDLKQTDNGRTTVQKTATAKQSSTTTNTMRQQQNVFYLKQLVFDIDEDVPEIDTAYISDMNLALYNIGIDSSTRVDTLTMKQKKKISKYIDIRDELFDEIDTAISSFEDYEKAVSEMRSNNIEIMKHNVSVLYAAHLRHVQNKLQKKTMERVRVYYGDKSLLMCDSQREFITNSINTILNA